MQKILILIGVVILILGVAWPWIQKLGLGRLPGDIVFERENVRIYIPIVTMLLISIVLSAVLWLIRK